MLIFTCFHILVIADRVETKRIFGVCVVLAHRQVNLENTFQGYDLDCHIQKEIKNRMGAAAAYPVYRLSVRS